MPVWRSVICSISMWRRRLPVGPGRGGGRRAGRPWRARKPRPASRESWRARAAPPGRWAACPAPSRPPYSPRLNELSCSANARNRSSRAFSSAISAGRTGEARASENAAPGSRGRTARRSRGRGPWPQMVVGDVPSCRADTCSSQAESAPADRERGQAGESEEDVFELVEVGDDPSEEVDRRSVGRAVSADEVERRATVGDSPSTFVVDRQLVEALPLRLVLGGSVLPSTLRSDDGQGVAQAPRTSRRRRRAPLIFPAQAAATERCTIDGMEPRTVNVSPQNSKVSGSAGASYCAAAQPPKLPSDPTVSPAPRVSRVKRPATHSGKAAGHEKAPRASGGASNGSERGERARSEALVRGDVAGRRDLRVELDGSPALVSSVPRTYSTEPTLNTCGQTIASVSP
jgi:hypothetical protein